MRQAPAYLHPHRPPRSERISSGRRKKLGAGDGLWARLARQGLIVGMVVTEIQLQLVQVPERRDPQRVLEERVATRAADRRVLVGILENGKTVVQIDDQVVRDVHIERQLGNGGDENPV